MSSDVSSLYCVFAAGSWRVRTALPREVRTTQLDSVDVFCCWIGVVSVPAQSFQCTWLCLWVRSQTGILSCWLEGWNLRQQWELVCQTAEDGELRDWDSSWCMPSSDPQTDSPHFVLCCFPCFHSLLFALVWWETVISRSASCIVVLKGEFVFKCHICSVRNNCFYE